jgi:hypothetical protein
MTEIDKETWAVIIVILMVVFIPIGALMVMTSPEPYHVTTGTQLREAADTTGLKIIQDLNVTLRLPGATGGHSYMVEDKDGNTFTIFTQSFDSEESRDAAIKAHNAQAVGKGRPLGELIVIGDQLIYIHPTSGAVRKTIVPELLKKKGQV